MALPPTASEITVREVLAKFEAEFAPVAEAVGNGEFALWVGSGISRRAPSLGDLIERALDYIRERAIDPNTATAFMPAFQEALGLADIEPAAITAQYHQPVAAWPKVEREAIIGRLWNKYSRVLDICIAGKAPDFVLWEAIDIRRAFQNPEPPAAEHLCIAVLVLEGAVEAIASANWDGFIEAAIARLTNGVPGVLQVVVEPNQLREPPGRARLLKFHGCIVYAANEPAIFRRYLTGSSTQIIQWPVEPAFAAMRNEIVQLAMAQKTLVLGLSIQDYNLQTIFALATQVHAWPWPCAPNAPAHVFCEDSIRQGQRDVLRVAYGNTYFAEQPAIHEATLLRAWGESVLIALVLKVLGQKLAKLMALCLDGLGRGAIAASLAPFLTALRDDIAGYAVPGTDKSRTSFVNQAIALWSRMLAVFRGGNLPPNPDAYEALSNLTPALIETDPNARATGLGRLAAALSLLQTGRSAGYWVLGPPASDDLDAGVMTARALRPGAGERPLFVVKSAGEALTLQKNGAIANDSIIIHGDDLWHRTMPGGATSRRVSSAPGRNGRASATHVSLGDLLDRCTDAVTLQQEFVAEMMV